MPFSNTSASRGFRSLAPCFALGIFLAGSSASGQSFNIDINSATGAGAGVPIVTFGGAAAQTGVWNNVPSTGAGPFVLNSLAGNPTAVTIAFSGTASGSFGFDNTSSTGDYAALLEDCRNVPAGEFLGMSISGLEPGLYQIVTYAIAPDNASFTCTPAWRATPSTTTTSSGPVGGVMPVNAFAVDVTHGVTTCLVLPGSVLEGSISRNTAATPGTLSGIQIKKIAAPARLYVGSPAPAPVPTLITGDSWARAIPELRDALAIAAVDPAVTEIWCRGGTYKATTGTDRAATFTMRNNLAIYGSFAGTETLLSQRVLNRESYSSILSAEIGTPVIEDNGYNVVNAEFATSNSVLDGFALTRGCAFPGGFTEPRQIRGGGVYVGPGSPTLRNLRIVQNTGNFGGGAAISTGGPTFTNVDFVSNGDLGFDSAGSVAVQHWALSGVAVPLVSYTGCRFIDNQITPTRLDNVVSIAFGARASFTNCLFADNGRPGTLGVVQSVLSVGDASVNVVNCTFANNRTNEFGTIAYRPDSSSSLAIRNCILWGNRSLTPWSLQQQQIYNTGTTNLLIVDSIIEGWDGSIPDGPAIGFNYAREPRFVSPLGPDGVRGGTDGNFRVAAGSAAIDSGFNSWITGFGTDLDGLPRRVDIAAMPDTGVGSTNPVVDRGCYEYQASTRYCVADVAGPDQSVGADGALTADDIIVFLGWYFANNLLGDFARPDQDPVPDGVLNADDIIVFLGRFFAGCP